LGILTAAILGVVQGLTEFLPVSSSAHLILARELFGVQMDPRLELPFDVACHGGTRLAVVSYLRADLSARLRALPRLFARPAGADVRRMWLIAAGTVPIVIVGALGGGALEDALRNVPVVCVTLTLGAILLLVAERARAHDRSDAELTARDAVLIGVAQATALVPGVSRSGVTIATGMLLGYGRAGVARFTFLLSIPAILAAAAKEGLELRHGGLLAADAQVFLIGMAASALVGYLAVKYLIRYLADHRLDVFAWYRLALAAVLLASLLLR
jgi:undecaprenyl-diphosphatase